MSKTPQTNGEKYNTDNIDINKLAPGVWNGSSQFLSLIFTWLLFTLIIPLTVLLPQLHHIQQNTLLYTVIRYSVVLMPIVGSIHALYYIYPLFVPVKHTHIDPTPFVDITEYRKVTVQRVLIIIHGGAKVGLRSQKDVQHIINHTILPILDTNRITYTTIYTKYSKHAVSLIRSMPIPELQQYDAIMSAGGDGLFDEIVNGMLQRTDKHKVPIAVIPLGTGNSFMHDLQCLDIKRSVLNLVDGNVYKGDVNLLTDPHGLKLYSINTAGFGIVGETAVVAEADIYRRVLRGSRYDICAIWILLKAVNHHFISTYNNTTVNSDNVNLAFVNNTQHFGNGLRSCPRAKLNDGLLDVIYLIDATRIDMLKLFLLMPVGQHTKHKCVKYEQVKKVTFHDMKRPTSVITVDGENVVYRDQLTIECLHNAIEVFANPQTYTT